MVIDKWRIENFKGLTAQKTWLSLNDIEKQSSKNEIRARLNIKNQDKFLKLCSDNETVLEVARNLALYVGLQNKIYKKQVFSLIMNGVIDNLVNSKIETLILAVSENLYPIIYAKVSGRPRGQRLSASLTWDFTKESLYSWIENNNFESISTTELNVKLEYLRKDEVGLLILNKFFDAESILKFMHAVKNKSLTKKAQLVDSIGDSNIKIQLSLIDTINPAVVKICNKVKEYMGNIDIFNSGAPTYISIITSSLSAYYAKAEIQGQSAAYLVFCEYISNQLTQLCCMEIQCENEVWDWTKESLRAWTNKHPKHNLITLHTPTKETNKKLYLIFNLLVFNRIDLSIWGVPATGKTQAVFWGDAL